MGGREGNKEEKERGVNEVRGRLGRVHLVEFSLVSATASSDISTAQPDIWYIGGEEGDGKQRKEVVREEGKRIETTDLTSPVET